jgi:hypothetical protein
VVTVFLLAPPWSTNTIAAIAMSTASKAPIALLSAIREPPIIRTHRANARVPVAVPLATMLCSPGSSWVPTLSVLSRFSGGPHGAYPKAKDHELIIAPCTYSASSGAPCDEPNIKTKAQAPAHSRVNIRCIFSSLNQHHKASDVAGRSRLVDVGRRPGRSTVMNFRFRTIKVRSFSAGGHSQALGVDCERANRERVTTSHRYCRACPRSSPRGLLPMKRFERRCSCSESDSTLFAQ